MKLVPMWLRDMHGMHGETEVALYSDHLAAIEQARKEEREAWSKWADAVVAELELRAKINNDPYLEISQGRLVELDTLRARKS